MIELGIIGVITLAVLSSILLKKKKKNNDNTNTVIKESKPIKSEIKEHKSVKTQNQIKGEAGEEKTAKEFKNFFESVYIDYKILKNVYLKFENGQTTEVDVIIISETGIYVIENKNYRGWIFGSFKDEQWTDSYPNGIKFKFYNPLKQNYTHIRTLKKYIGEKYHNFIYSYIVFNDECELKKVPYNSEYIKIIKSQDISKTLSESNNNKCLAIDEIENLYNMLYEFTQISEEDKQKHIESIKM